MVSVLKVMIVIAALLAPSGGNGACESSDWTYRGQSDTCYKLHRHSRTWIKARDHCRQFPRVDVTGHLAKIDDRITNAFLTNNVLSGMNKKVWIGLYYDPEVKDYRWDGFPDKVPRYTTMLKKPLRSEATGVTRKGYWIWEDEMAQEQYYFVCEHDAKKPTLSCPSVMMKGQKFPKDGMTCRIYHSGWRIVKLFSPKDQNNPVASCRSDGNCYKEDDDYTASMSRDGNTFTFNFNGVMTLDLAGQWRCSAFDSNRKVITSTSCDLLVKEACENDTWTYHSQSHSCMKTFLQDSTWYGAQSQCRKYPGNPGSGSVGHLAKVEDRETEKFILDNVYPSWQYGSWIGLFCSPQSTYQWDGFPGQAAVYDKNIEMQQEDSVHGVVMTSTKWQEEDANSFRTIYTCQYQAKAADMPCPEKPFKVGESTETGVDCQVYSSSWTKITWTTPQFLLRPVAFCTGYDVPCATMQSDYSATMARGGLSTLHYNGAITRSHEGTWTCSVYGPTSVKEASVTCDVKVYEQPGNITCSHEMQPEKVVVSCRTERVYPKALCQWSIIKTRVKFTEGLINRKWAKEKCYRGQRGHVKVNVKMFPDIHGFDLSNMPGAFTIVTREINIVVPETPTFWSNSRKVENQQQLVIVDGHDVVLTCQVSGGDPPVVSTTLDCSQLFNQKTDTESGPQVSTSIQASRDMSGKKCSCWGNHITGKTTATVTFKAIIKPSDITCTSTLSPDALVVSCKTDKVYPQAVCEWSYKRQNEERFISVSVDYASPNKHSNSYDTNRYVYYKTQCSVRLPAELFDSGDGQFTARILMYPGLQGIDRQITPEAFVSSEESVNIELPDKPVFIMSNKSLVDSTLYLKEGDGFRLECHINGGNPRVLTTTLSCDFALVMSGATKRTKAGSIYVMDTSGRSDMDGMTCSCWGNHITGETRASSLTFNIFYPPEITTFTANGMASRLEVDLSTDLHLDCQAAGNPAPDIRIWKNTTLIVTGKATGQLVYKGRQARCVDNGQYRCSATQEGTDNGQDRTTSRDLDLRVKCPPTSCLNTGKDQEVGVEMRKPLDFNLCVMAFPLPVGRYFQLEKEIGSKWNPISNDKFEMGIPRTVDYLENLVLRFRHVLESSHLGRYRLLYSPGNGLASPDIHFRLIERQRQGQKGQSSDDGGGGKAGTIAGIAVAVIVVIIIACVFGVYYFIRKRQPGSKNRDERRSDARADHNGANEDRAGPSRTANDESASDAEVTYANVHQPENSAMYANCDPHSPANQQEDKELVYIQLDFSQEERKQKRKSKKEDPKKKAETEIQTDTEGTEYACIDVTATMLMKTHPEKADRSEEGDDDEKGDDEE